MAARKTASILNMIERTNNALAQPTPESLTKEQGIGFRMGVATALESVLHEAGVYNGFTYLESAGIPRNPDGSEVRPFSCEDESRRSYSIHPKLRN